MALHANAMVEFMADCEGETRVLNVLTAEDRKRRNVVDNAAKSHQLFGVPDVEDQDGFEELHGDET